MSVKYEEFDLFKEFVEKVNKIVKLFYISQHFYTEQHFGLFISGDDKAYGVGENGCGQLGLGHNQNVVEFTEIPELSGKRICEFFEGNSCMFARSENREIYCWGGNNWGQLGVCSTTQMNECLKPTKNLFFQNKSIRKICCGDHHNLGLSTDGRVYAWGKNCYSQMGCGKTMTIISKPELIEFDCDDQDYDNDQVFAQGPELHGGHATLGSVDFSKLKSVDQVVSPKSAESSFSRCRTTSYPRSLSSLSPTMNKPIFANQSPNQWVFPKFENKIKDIHVFSNSCFAINEKNQVYFWGEDIWGILVEQDEIVERPKLILNRIASQVYCNTEEIFFCHGYTITNWKESNEEPFTFIDIHWNPLEYSMEKHQFIFQDSDNVFEFIDNNFKKTNYKNIFDYYLNKYQSTFKTIHNKN